VYESCTSEVPETLKTSEIHPVSEFVSHAPEEEHKEKSEDETPDLLQLDFNTNLLSILDRKDFPQN